MTSARIALLILIIGLTHCKSQQDKKAAGVNASPVDTTTTVAKTIPVNNPQQSNHLTDSIKRFEVDDYPVTAAMLKCNDQSSACPISYKDLTSLDKVWFTNDTLEQTLVFEMYTDGFRMAIFHFDNNDIPTELIKKMEFNTPDGEIAADKQKLAHFKNFIPLAKKIKAAYFKSAKGFKLGDSRNKIINAYGEPTSIKVKNGVAEYEWDFTGELLYDGKENLKGKPLAKDNFGHQATLYFRNNKLTGVILHNDIP